MLRGSLETEAITPHVFFSEGCWTKASLPQKTGNGSLVNGPSPRGQKVKGHIESLSTRGTPAEVSGGWLPL